MNSKLTMPFADSPSNAPGWREVGMFFSCVPNEVYPWDPAVVRAIWGFDPDVIPMWVNWVFQAPNDTSSKWRTVVFGRHAIGRYVANPTTAFTLKTGEVLMPSMPCQGLRFKRPNILVRILEGAPNEDLSSDLPGGFVPFDWRVYYKLEQDFIRTTVAELKRRYVQEKLEKQQKAKDRMREEAAYRSMDLDAYANKRISQLSDVEIKEINAQQLAKQQGIRTGESKPFVDLGNTIP